MITKGFDLAFKDVDTKRGIISGYFASFGTRDSHGDIIEKGAFKKTIQEQGPQGKQLIKWLLDHEKNKAIGKLTELYEDNIGLAYVGKVGTHSLGQDFMKMVESEIINQHSFGYQVIKEQHNPQTKSNHLKELMMFEGSSIQFRGSNENTPITGIKSLEDALQMCEKMEKFIRNSNATDSTLIEVNNQLTSLQKSIEPLISTQTTLEAEDIENVFKKLSFN